MEGTSGYNELAIALKKLKNVQVILVHGGGAEISVALKDAHIESKWIDGLRITTEKEIKIVEQILSETVNSRIAGILQKNGVACRRMSGKTKGLMIAEPLFHPTHDLGFVGQVKTVQPEAVIEALNAGEIPVISPISADQNGQTYNINADSAAGAIAGAVACTDLIYFTDVPGVKAGEEFLSQLTIDEAEKLIDTGVITGGMVAKMKSVFDAISAKVPQVHITRWHGSATLQDILDQNPESGTTIKDNENGYKRDY